MSLCSILLLTLIATVATGQTFRTTGTLNQARASHTATLLSNGMVLVVGGYGQSGIPLASTEIYDPTTGRWRMTSGRLNVSRASHAAVRLNDGKVLIIAGVTQGAQGNQATGSTEIFDPATETFAPTTPLSSTIGDGQAFNIGNNQVAFIQRGQTSNVEIFNYQTRQWSLGAPVPPGGAGPAMTQLIDGRIFVCGGSEQGDVEIYNPSTNSWQVMAPMTQGRAAHTATALQNGKVLIASGIRSTFGQNFPVPNVEIYDPAVLPNGATIPGPSISGPGPGGAGFASVLLLTGKVLITGGGYTPSYGAAFSPLADTTAYDFQANTLSPMGPMNVARTAHTLTLLPSGLVLIAGGRTDQFSAPTPVAELYGSSGFPSQPTSFTTTGSLGQPRISSRSTLLKSGLVLISGGALTGGSPTATAELYDPSTSTFRPTLHPMNTPRGGHSASLLPDGRVLIAGGNNGQPWPNGQLSSTELFDPVTETFAVGPPMVYSRDSHQAVTLNDGRIMVISGFGNGTTIPSYGNDTVELFNPALMTWTSAARVPSAPSCCFGATRLPDGRVFVSGGYSGGASVFIYDPVANTWATKSPMLVPRAEHGVSTLPNGKVLIVGGTDLYSVQTANEIYDPVALPNGSSQVSGSFAGGGSNSLVTMPNGNVWVAGGATPRWNGASVCSYGKTAAQQYDYTNNSWTDLTPMLIGRYAFSAALLASGKILVTGGIEHDCPPTSFYGGSKNFLSQAELWHGIVPATTGIITVTTNLPVATFTITGPPSYSGSGTSFTQANAPAGTYTITYGAVSGYTKPPNETKTLTTGGSIIFTGTYQHLLPGTIVITSNHPQATFSITPAVIGAPTGGPFPRTLTNLAGGSYMVTFNVVPRGGYTVPSLSSQIVNGNTVTFTGTYTLIPGSTVDTDDDGLPDEWEASGHGGVPLPAMGANPFHKDIFIEVDWLQRVSAGTIVHSHRPDAATMNDVIRAFLQAPVSNPDEHDGITLHIDVGQSSIMIPALQPDGTIGGIVWGAMSKGNALTESATDIGTVSGCDYHWIEFGNLKLANASSERKPIFHYAIMAHDLPEFTCEDVRGRPTGISRNGANIRTGARDFIVALNGIATAKEMLPINYRKAVRTTFMHELGHNLGITHGGIITIAPGITHGDLKNHKPNYPSIMNYFFPYGLLTRSGTVTTEGKLDYSRVQVINLQERNLAEAAGLGAGAMHGVERLGTRHYCMAFVSIPPGAQKVRKTIDDATQSIDWDCDGDIEHSVAVEEDVNGDGTKDIVQAGAVDWGVLVFTGGGGIGSALGGIFSEPATSVIREQTVESVATQAPAGGCYGDANVDGVVDARDFEAVRVSFGRTVGQPGFNASVDMDNNGVINIVDLSIVSRQQGCRIATK